MEKSILVKKIEEMIGPGRQFSSTNELAQYLGLAVLEWLDKLQVQVVFPNQPIIEHSATKVQSQEVDFLKKRLDELQKENDQLKLQNAELRGANDVLRSVLKIDLYNEAPEKKHA